MTLQSGLTGQQEPVLAVSAAAAVLPFAVGLVIAGALTWAVWLGIRVRRREPARPRPAEQPRMPAEGPVHEVREHREAEEVPRNEQRLTPHQLKGQGTSGSRHSDDEKPER